jgi:hypothetical protein
MAHVKEKGHLPWMRSEKQVAEEGSGISINRHMYAHMYEHINVDAR